MNPKSIIITLVSFLLPLFASAQIQSRTALENIAYYIRDIVNILLPIAFILILLFFFWGLALYVRSAGDDDSKERGRRLMVGGVIALFIAASIWGLVAFIGSIFDIDRSDNANIRVPGVKSNLGGRLPNVNSCPLCPEGTFKTITSSGVCGCQGGN